MNAHDSNRFGKASTSTITSAIEKSVPSSTTNTKNSIWRQFEQFCKEKQYVLLRSTTTSDISNILTDWAYNMKKGNGEDYKESVVKTMWNVTAKIIQEKYFNEFNRKIDPFSDIEFKVARDAKNAKRKELQAIPEKRKQSSVALNKSDIYKMMKIYNEDTPEGLQKKLYHIIAYELAWRGGEAARCKIYFFKYEKKLDGTFSNRLEYNPIFSKTCQGGAHKCADSKWLAPNTTDPDVCPVRLYKKLLEKRTMHITSDRLFLTVNQFWKNKGSKGWFKNMPIGVNEIGKWTKQSAQKIGINLTDNKVTNHSNRSSAVSNFAKSGVGEQQLLKMTGHANAKSLNPYLQLDEEHHANLLSALRQESSTPNNLVNHSNILSNAADRIKYNNCTFHINTMNVYKN